MIRLPLATEDHQKYERECLPTVSPWSWADFESNQQCVCAVLKFAEQWLWVLLYTEWSLFEISLDLWWALKMTVEWGHRLTRQCNVFCVGLSSGASHCLTGVFGSRWTTVICKWSFRSTQICYGTYIYRPCSLVRNKRYASTENKTKQKFEVRMSWGMGIFKAIL